MGRGRWSMRSVGGEERHTLEFGFKYMFSIRAGPKSDGIRPDIWWASSRDASLGDHASLEAAKRTCEDEARRLIEASSKHSVADYDDRIILEQWQTYLASPKRMRSVKMQTRYK